MFRIASLVAIFAATVAASGAAAPDRQLAKPHTVLSTRSHVTQFAQDGEWVAWITAQKGCGRRLHLLSLRTGRRVTVEHVGSPVGCGVGGLALAGNRAAWMTLVGAGNRSSISRSAGRARRPRNRGPFAQW
jgi:hypothetical protein